MMGDGKWRGWLAGAFACHFVALLGCRKDPEFPAAEAVPAGDPKAATRSALELPQVRVAKGEFVDPRDSQVYADVRFDSLFAKTDSGYRPYGQVWMARNLAYRGKEADGQGANPKMWCSESGESVWNPSAGFSMLDEKFCQAGNGLVYRWTGAMALDDFAVTDSGPGSLRYDSSYSYMGRIKPLHQGICPDGWRLPTKTDWELLLWNLERNRRFLQVAFRPAPDEPECEGDGCGEVESDPPPEILSYLKGVSEDHPEWGKELDAQDPYGFGLLPRYAFWTTTLDTIPRDDDFPNAPRVSVFVDPTGRYWGWQAKYRYWNIPQSLKEGNYVRCIQWKDAEGKQLVLPAGLE